MPYLQPQAEKLRHHRHQAEHQAQREVGGQTRDVAQQPAANRLAAGRAQPAPPARVVGNGRVQLVQHKGVFDPAGHDARRKQQHAGEGGKQGRRSEQVHLVQHMCGLFGRDHGLATGRPQRGTDEQHHGHHCAQVAGYGRHLRAVQVRDFVDEAVNAASVLQLLEPRSHGRGGDGRLFGGHRPVQQHDQHKGQGVIEACCQSRPERRKRQGVDAELGPGGQPDDRATPGGAAQHVAVFGAVAGDVMLA